MNKKTINLLKENRTQFPSFLRYISFFSAVLVTTGYIVSSALGANTTIGNNISTSGNLTIGGTALLSGALNASSTLQVTGNATLYGTLAVSGTGTSTYSGGIQTTALNITSTLATSTFANGIQLSAGCFRDASGSCVGGGGGSGTINAGTIGQVPYYAANGTTLTATSTLAIGSLGNVGIGTTTPQFKLHLYSDSDQQSLFRLEQFNGGSFFNSPAITSFTAGGTAASPSATVSNDWLLFIGARGYQTVTNEYGAGSKAAIIFQAAENWTNTNQGTKIIFQTTANGGTSRTEKMRLTDAGNLGIGTTNPTAMLHVNGSALISTSTNSIAPLSINSQGTSNSTEINITSADNDSNIRFVNTGNQNWQIGNSFGSLRIYHETLGSIPFNIGSDDSISMLGPISISTTTGSASNFAGSVTLATSAGNVGIGTTTPSAKLSLTGSGTGSGRVFAIANSNNIEKVRILDSGKVAIDDGTTGLLCGGTDALCVSGAFRLLNGSQNSGRVLISDVSGAATWSGSLIVNGSNVGIGTTSPSQPLSVHGNALFSGNISAANLTATGTLTVTGTGTSTFSNGIQLSAGCFRDASGSCVGGGGGSGTINAGTVGQIPYYSGATALTATSTLFVSTASNVGIGTTTPTHKLTVAGKTAAFNSALDGSLSGWVTNTNSLPVTANRHSSVAANGYVYVLGGLNSGGSTIYSTVYYAKLNGDGSTGSWQTNPTSLPTTLRSHMSVAANGYVYVIGGHNGTSAQSAVYYAKINSDGTLGTWQTNSNSLPAARWIADSVAANGYVYVVAGIDSSGTKQTTVYYAKLNSDGSTGPWLTNPNGIPSARYLHAAVIANGYMYVIGGDNTSNVAQSTVFYAKVNSDGTTQAWSTNTNSLPDVLHQHKLVVANGYIYTLGGNNGGTASSPYFARLNSDGSTGVWQTDPSGKPASVWDQTTVTANGYIYFIGGTTNNTDAVSTVYYTSTARVSMLASLDLLGLANTTFSYNGETGRGSIGSSIYSGDIFSNGNLQVSGSGLFFNDVSIAGGLSVNASTSGLQSGSIFSVRNATSSSPILTSLYNGNVGIGTTSPGTLLSLHSGSDFVNFGVTSTSTFSKGINLNGGCFAINGTCIGGGGGGSGTVNSGTQGQVAFYDATGTAVSGTSTLFMSTASKVGIGTTSPSQSLSVQGTALFSSNVTMSGGQLRVPGGTVTAPGIIIGDPITSPNQTGIFNPGGTLSFVDDNGVFDWRAAGSGFNNSMMRLTAQTTGCPGTGACIHLGNVSGSGTTEVDKVGIYWAAANTLGFLTNGLDRGRISSTGDWGIGTTTPSQKLSVQGNALFSGNINAANITATGTVNVSAGSAYTYNSANVITASTTLNNYFFGTSGNLTMSGSSNIAVGAEALDSNVFGVANTAIGTQALSANTNGNSNTALGMGALGFNTTGFYNTAIGRDALFDLNITAGDGSGANTAIGRNTGRGITTGVNNTIIGANVTGLASTLSNNIIIADGAGNQRINVGSTGSVGIGTTTSITSSTTRLFITDGNATGTPSISQAVITPLIWGASTANFPTFGLENTSIGVKAGLTAFTDEDGPRASILTFSNHPLAFETGADGAALWIGTNDNVGIGTTTPGERLVVSGNFSLTGNILPSLAPTTTALSGNATSTIDTSAIPQGHSITIGTDGFPIIAYQENLQNLLVAKCNNLACSAPTISTVVSGNVGSGTSTISIAIGTDGRPFITYQDGPTGELRLAICGNASCSSGNSTTTIDIIGSGSGASNSIALAPEGIPVISYYHTTSGELRFATCGTVGTGQTPCINSPVSTSTLDGSGARDAGQFNSIAIGADGIPVISYYDVTNGNLNVAQCFNSTCGGSAATTSPDTGGDVGQYTSVAIGTDSLPIISYYDVTNADLKVAKCANTGCTTGTTVTTQDNAGDVGRFSSITITTGGLPLIAYYDVTNADLKVEGCANASCSSNSSHKSVDTDNNVGEFASISIGTDGMPIIAYYSRTAGNLRFVRCNNLTCQNSGGGFFTGSDLGSVGKFFNNAYVESVWAKQIAIKRFDLAEDYYSRDALEPGEIVSLDPNEPLYIRKAEHNGARVIGVVSTEPALVLSDFTALASNDKNYPVALAGRVPVKVNMEGGEIRIGDPIALSSISGVGKKAAGNEVTIGYALDSFSASVNETGTIRVFVNLNKSVSEQVTASADNSSSLLAQVAGVVKSWLESMQVFIENGLVKLKDLVARKVTVEQLCVGTTCITEDELKGLLEKNQLASAGESLDSTNTASTTPTDTEAPVITLNGPSSIELEKSTQWSDPGATVTDDVNPNIGLSYMVNGTPTSNEGRDLPQIDTNIPGTSLITYTATDEAGNTATATRTVVVKEPPTAHTTEATETTTTHTSSSTPPGE